MLIVGTTAHLEDLDRSYTYAEDVSVTALAVGSFIGESGACCRPVPTRRGASSTGSASSSWRSSTSHRWCACRRRPPRAWRFRQEAASWSEPKELIS